MPKLVAILAAALVFPPAAAAHLRTGTVAVDYRAQLTRRPVGPVTVAVYQSDLALHLSVRPGHTVTVYGYLGEPFFRIGDGAVTVNKASPTAAAARMSTHGMSVVWHDVRTSRSRWSVPVAVDGRRETIAGATDRRARPSLALWAVAVAAFVLAACVLRSPVAAGVLSSCAAIIVAAAFALSTYASPGTWIAGVDELVFAAAGVGVFRWGPPSARLPSALWLSLLGVAIGLSKGEVFLHAIVLSALPGTLVRALTVIAIGAGIAGGALTWRAYAR